MSNLATSNSSEYSLSVQVFRPEHTEAVGQLISSIQRNEFKIPITLEQQPDLADIPRFYQHGKGNFWVVIAKGRVVGTISLLDIGNDQAALRKMFIDVEFRGPKYSTAKLLLDEALASGKVAGFREIYLGTTAKFLAAHRFYEKSGFIEIGKEQLPTAFPIMAVDTKFYMIKI